MAKYFRRFGKQGKSLDILETRQAGNFGKYVADFDNGVFQFGTVDELVERMSVVITAGEINSRNAEFGSNKRDVGEGAASSLETFAGNVSLKVGIVTIVKHSVIFTFAVKLNDEFQVVKFFGQ